jgi:hypothetical protein
MATIAATTDRPSGTAWRVFTWFGRWGRRTFLIYAAALLPFFAFNTWFVYEVVTLDLWPEPLDGARFRRECSDAGTEPMGVAGDGRGD